MGVQCPDQGQADRTLVAYADDAPDAGPSAVRGRKDAVDPTVRMAYRGFGVDGWTWWVEGRIV